MYVECTCFWACACIRVESERGLFSVLAFSWIRLWIRLECLCDLAIMSDQELSARAILRPFLTTDRARERIDAGRSWIPQSSLRSCPGFFQRWSLALYASGCLLKNWYCNTGRKEENIVVLCGPSPFLERCSRQVLRQQREESFLTIGNANSNS